MMFLVKKKRHQYYLAVFIAAAALIVYLPAMQNNFVEWDDGPYVLDNLFIRSFNGSFFQWAFFHFHAANWHPLTWISHAADYAVWGLNPAGHHLTNIILHALNTFLAVILVIRILESVQERSGESPAREFLTSRTIALAGATAGLLFGFHPLHVESVAWIAERKDLLCALFFLLGIMMYIRRARGMEQGAEGKKNGASTPRSMHHAASMPCPIHHAAFADKYYLATLGFFILALLSKPMAVTFPLVLLILDWHPFERIDSFKTFKKAFVEKLPFFVLSTGSSLVTILAQRAGGTLQSSDFAPFGIRLLVAAQSLVAYLVKMVLPLNLVPFYPYPNSATWSPAPSLISVVLVILVTAICCAAGIKRRKLWPAAWAFYVITLIPVLGIVQVGGQAMADRYAYLPSLGPFLILGLAAGFFFKKVRLGGKRSILLFVLPAVLVVAFLAALTIKQISVWRNSITLWSYVIQKEPGVAVAYKNRGVALGKMNQPYNAVNDLSKAIALSPDYSEAYLNRGISFEKLGRIEDALADFNAAVAVDPSYYPAYFSRGNTLYNLGRVNEAIQDFNAALALSQDDARVFRNRGFAWLRIGRGREGVSDLARACELGDGFACEALKPYGK